MYPTSGRFLATLPQAHRVITQVQLFRTNGDVVDLAHTGGSVTADRGQTIRRTCSVTSADVSLIPTTPADELAVYGARLRISRGIDFGDGTSELVPLGHFRLDSVSGDPALGPVTFSGQAIECIVADDRLTAPYRATGTVAGAIEALILRSIPGAEVISLIPSTSIGPRVFDVEADPWAAVQEIAAAGGAECYTNADGTFVIAELPDVTTTNPVWTVAAGEGGVYIKGTRSMRSSGVHNGVLARGENTESGAAAVSYLAVDDDPGSPTYWDGPYGRRPLFYGSPTLTTTAAATAAARLKLRAAKAPNAAGDFSAMPNPALEPGDVLRVAHPDGLRELHQVQSITVPLEPGGDFPITTISAKGDS
ncbi:DUF5047 domain-containing protein [Streptomyces microflavus]|uniref:DUF5047 domain-containing protein n=1 Tax=Streptomyces microflavus TaxID=1919 RepID=UPI0033BD5638